MASRVVRCCLQAPRTAWGAWSSCTYRKSNEDKLVPDEEVPHMASSLASVQYEGVDGLRRAIRVAILGGNLMVTMSKWLAAVLLRKLFVMVEDTFGSGESLLGNVTSPFWKAIFLVNFGFFDTLALAIAVAVPMGIFGVLRSALPIRLAGTMARARRALLVDISLNSMTIAESNYSASFLLEQIYMLSEYEAETKYVRIGEAQRIKVVAIFCIIVFWQGSLLSAVMTGVIVLLELVLRTRVIAPHLEDKSELTRRVHDLILDILRGADIVAMHNAESKEMQALASVEAPGIKIDRDTSRAILGVTGFTLFLLTVTMPVLLAFSWALFDNIEDAREAANMLFALTAMLIILDEGHKSLNRLSMSSKAEAAYRQSLAIVEPLLAAGQAALAAERAERVMTGNADKTADAWPPPELPDVAVGPGALSFSHVTVQYPSASAPAVHDVTFTIPRGTSMAIVAESGGGKSTLFRAASALIHHEGEISFGDVVLDDDTKQALRARMGFVSQDSKLFARSIRDNVWYGHAAEGIAEADDAKIWSVLTGLGLASWVESLRDGLDTVLTSEQMVSGGQAQRLQIARLLCRDNVQYVLLDECMSALDPVMRTAVTRALKQFLRGKTALIITHSHDTISDLCDTVLDLGKLQADQEGAITTTRAYLAGINGMSRIAAFFSSITGDRGSTRR
ncbi:ABC transporter, putative [Hondaea fermentalgiana]|uniref:ABC transporter, putative n=1 Tax=Hondaea fermentalgiana TaxID=2315210 RepID=A0A2R5GZJ6_9STRA|nr:ABC transporter, putative [Hondaea fermentalgiana]|eukprot:GBG33464.1 ABC transporter, putative [Hondaea fermentalgiana]